MTDFNQVLLPGDVDNGVVNTVVEIPEGSTLKIEWDRERAAFTLDRVEPQIFAKPVNYWFIPMCRRDSLVKLLVKCQLLEHYSKS